SRSASVCRDDSPRSVPRSVSARISPVRWRQGLEYENQDLPTVHWSGQKVGKATHYYNPSGKLHREAGDRKHLEFLGLGVEQLFSCAIRCTHSNFFIYK